MQPNGNVGYFNKIKPVLVIFCFIIFGLLVYVFIKDQRLHIVNTTPSTNNISNVTPVLKINFNKQLSSKALSVFSNPLIVSSYSIDNKTIDINLITPMDQDKTYTITIRNVSDVNGKDIINRSFMFKPKNIPLASLSRDQQLAQLNRQVQYSHMRSDPIFTHLPYSTLDFSLSAYYPSGSSEGTGPVIAAQLLIAPGVSGAAETSDVSYYKQEVINYIKSLGLDPTKYTIQYQVVLESITGT